MNVFDRLPIENPDDDPVFPLGDGLPNIRFLRIDTDAGVDPDSMHRFLALGRFEKHLRKLSQRLANAPPATDEIRVLMLHHSVIRGGRSLYVVEESRDALNRFVLDHDVSLLMCGHTHRAGLQYHAAGSGRQVLEARCGTTSQIGREDYSIMPREIGDPVVDSRVWRRSLLVHRVHAEGAHIDWQASVYVQQQTEPGGFEPAERLPTRHPVEEVVRVWPRAYQRTSQSS